MSFDYLLSASLPILVVVTALLLERFLPLASSIDPLAFFRFVCHRMALKVLSSNASKQQAIIAGSLALLVLVLPVLLIAYLIHSFASYPWLIDILLLWLLLQYRQDSLIFSKTIKALNENKKQLAKNLAQQKLKRDTDTLSRLGLTKASLEGTFLRYHYQQFTLILCYLLLGPIVAIAYRLSYEAQQQWSIKEEQFRYFGLFSSLITMIIQVIPAFLMSLSFVLINHPMIIIEQVISKSWWQQLGQNFRLLNSQSLLLHTLSQALEVNTGGPVIINKQKYEKTRFIAKTNKEPELSDHQHLKMAINKHLIASLSILAAVQYFIVR